MRYGIRVIHNGEWPIQPELCINVCEGRFGRFPIACPFFSQPTSICIMCNTCYSCSISISVPTNGAVVNLPQTNRLDGSKLLSVFIRRNASGTRKDDQGKTLAADTVIFTAHLHLFNKNGTEVLQMPLESLQRDFNSPEPLRLCRREIDTASSYIRLDTAAAGYNADHVIELVCEYECPQICG